MTDLLGYVCDNCGKQQGPDDWFTGRSEHWWCSECATIVHEHERVYGTVILTCPECGWTITANIGTATTTRDRIEPDDLLDKLLAKVTPENRHKEIK